MAIENMLRMVSPSILPCVMSNERVQCLGVAAPGPLLVRAAEAADDGTGTVHYQGQSRGHQARLLPGRISIKGIFSSLERGPTHLEDSRVTVHGRKRSVVGHTDAARRDGRGVNCLTQSLFTKLPGTWQWCRCSLKL